MHRENWENCKMSFMSGKTQEIGNFDKTEGIFQSAGNFLILNVKEVNVSAK